MLFVDGMNGVVNHNETVQWLYTLTGSLVSSAAAVRQCHLLARLWTVSLSVSFGGEDVSEAADGVRGIFGVQQSSADPGRDRGGQKERLNTCSWIKIKVFNKKDFFLLLQITILLKICDFSFVMKVHNFHHDCDFIFYCKIMTEA